VKVKVEDVRVSVALAVTLKKKLNPILSKVNMNARDEIERDVLLTIISL
jgi:hypothetical protein